MTHAQPLAVTTDIDARHWLAAFGIAAALHAAVFLQWPSNDQAGAQAPGVGGISVSIAMTASLAGAEQSSAEPAPSEQVPAEQVPAEHVPAEQTVGAASEPVPIETAAPVPLEPIVTPPIQEAVVEPAAEPAIPEVVPVEPIEAAVTPGARPEVVEAVEPPQEEAPVTELVAETVTELASEEVPPPRPPMRPKFIEPELVQPQIQSRTQPPIVQETPIEGPPQPEAASAEVPAAQPQSVQQNAASPAPATASSGQTSNAPLGKATDLRNSTGGAAVSAPSPSYIATLRLWLERHKHYPKMARRKRMQGVVLLYFRIGRDGSVLAQEIREASGHPLLDDAALEMLARAAPLPDFPESMPGDYLDVVLPVDYSLRGNQ